MAVAAYAAVVSLMQVLDQIRHPTRQRLNLDTDLIEALREKLSFLQDFLEVYSQRIKEEIEDLAREITDVANEAEDIIDFHVVDQLGEGSDLSSFCEDVEKVCEKFDSIKEELMMVKEERAVQEEQPRLSVPASSSALPSSGKSSMVGFDEQLVRIMAELTRHKSDLQIVPIVGMGGIGKTTLARNVFDHPCVVHHFHVRTWLTISQEYSAQEILVGVLGDRKNKESSESLAELGERLYKSLLGKRYLIVMDDVWSTKIWDELKSFFPNKRNGSRIMVTTRLSNVAFSLGSRNPYLMNFLDEDKSWNLLCEEAFAQEGCPPELEKIGKNIAISCRGLPLAIVVIGGLLANSNMTQEYWDFVAENVNSFANSGDDEHCLKILSLSYNNLPIHLKSCFLHLGGFIEAREVRVSELIKIWVAEGFLKPIRATSLEEAAEEYLKDLIDRNLILIRKWGRTGEIETCVIHDLLRDLCLRECHKEDFFRVPKVQHVNVNKNKRMCFLCSHQDTHESIDLPEVLLASRSTSLASCFVCSVCRIIFPQLDRLRYVRVMNQHHSSAKLLQPTRLGYLSITMWKDCKFVYPSPIPLLWNLQILYIDSLLENPISEIWEMPQLRHIIVTYVVLPDPVDTQIERKDCSILENLQTLSTIRNFRFTEEVLERIPNVKELRIDYSDDLKDWSYYSLYNLALLHKLESLSLKGRILFSENITFPCSLKELTLKFCEIPWEDMTIVGSLPNLEVLELMNSAFKGPEWNPVEGEFLRLKFLEICETDLVCWRAENIHFPNLESLVLRSMKNLEEIPSGIGDIATLRSIHLISCSDSVVNSAKQILEEQQGLGNEDLQVHGDKYYTYDRGYQIGAS